jgi:hypothetical protein
METIEIPAHLVRTVGLMRNAYPSGIPADEKYVVMSVMGDTGMSDRSIAAAFGYYYGQPYEAFLHDAATCNTMPEVTESAKEVVRNRLRPFGFDTWAEEP